MGNIRVSFDKIRSKYIHLLGTDLVEFMDASHFWVGNYECFTDSLSYALFLKLSTINMYFSYNNNWKPICGS